MDRERSKLQIVSLCVLLAMAILFAGLTGFSRQTKGISYEEAFLKLEQQEEKAVYSGKMKGEIVTAVCYEENGTDIVEFTVGDRYHCVGRVEYTGEPVPTNFGKAVPCIRIYCNDTLLFEGGRDEEMNMFFDKDGELTSLVSVKAVYSNDPWYNYELTAGDIFRLTNATASAARGSWALYAIVAFLSLIFAVTIAFPETLFYWQHFLSVRDPEPSDFFWAMHNISCVALPLLALIGYLIAVRTVA